ncbi:MAG TPA: porin [Candidatus Didemnitutus sp.]|jgi:phosphate-selective porin OprO/OprP
MRTSPISKFAPALLAYVVAAGLLPAADSDDLAQLREQLHSLEQKILMLERKQEIKDEADAVAAKAAPKIAVGDRGVTLASGDGANSPRIRGLVQFDNRLFFADDGIANNSFLLRRARIIAEGSFSKNTTFQIVPEFGGGNAAGTTTPSILDANIGITLTPELQFKFGKFKSPVGLELLQSDSWTFFDERSLVTNLVPNRDVGAQASGDLLGGKLNYAAGVFGGVADGASSGNADFDNDKDGIVRLFATPFKGETDSALSGVSFGVSGSYGREKTASGRTSGYRTDGQQTFFSYLTTTIADGHSSRISPQLDYRAGPFGLIGEFVRSTVQVRPSATGAKKTLANTAWQVGAGYVLTGEDSSFNGVVPRRNFNWANRTWGAVEVVARYADLKVDDAAFPLYAATAGNADEARAFGVGFNWYLNKVVRVSVDFYDTHFDLPPGAPAVPTVPVLKQNEESLISRVQISF